MDDLSYFSCLACAKQGANAFCMDGQRGVLRCILQNPGAIDDSIDILEKRPPILLAFNVGYVSGDRLAEVHAVRGRLPREPGDLMACGEQAGRYRGPDKSGRSYNQNMQCGRCGVRQGLSFMPVPPSIG